MGKREGTEIEISHHWPTIWSTCLFSETSIRIHKHWHSESVQDSNKRRLYEGARLTRTWRLHTPPLPLCPTDLLRFILSEFYLVHWLRTVRVFPRSVYWLLCMEVGSWKLSFLVTWLEAWVTWDHLAGFWREDNLDPSTCGISPNSTDFVSEVS